MKDFALLMVIALFAITIHSCKKSKSEGKITIDSTTLDTEFLNAIPYEGGASVVNFNSSLDWTIKTTDTKVSAWLEVTPTSGDRGTATITITAPRTDTPDERQSKISITAGSYTEDINVTQIGRLENIELTAFYNATGGDSWTNNTNWLSDKPLDQWYGVTITNNRVTHLGLGDNNLIGAIPSITGNMTKLLLLDLNGNKLTGSIPSSVIKHWRTIINQQLGYGFDLTNVALPGVKGILTDINGETLELSNIYSENKYTVLLNWDPSDPSSTSLIVDKLVPAYQQKHSDGLDIIAFTSSNANSLIEQNGMGAWKNFNSIDNPNTLSWTGNYPMSEVIDQDGNIVFTYLDNKDSDTRLGKSAPIDLIPLLEAKFGKIDLSADYESTDYSKDGEVLTLQNASSGKGINLVIVGDAFLDKDMGTNGKYEQRMREAMEHFFSEEPFKTYRSLYNVYTIKAVSKNEVYNTSSQTVFECKFGGGTLIYGDDNKVFTYASKVPSIETLDNLTIITILNSPIYAGTCYMYYNNASIAYCPIVFYKEESYRQIITHEAGGHGFAKLADEYFYAGSITAAAISKFQELKDMDWIANADITNNAATIGWAHFLSDSRYTGKVGVFEGCLTYTYGAYRPTNNSIMRGNTGGFNPPSREAIFKRIMTLSGTTYQYENFATYDAINRTSSAIRVRRAQAAQVDHSKFVPLAPPVIIRSSPGVRK